MHEFHVPADYEEPTENSAEPIIGEGQIALTISIQLDSYPQEGTLLHMCWLRSRRMLALTLTSLVGWRVDRLGLEAEEVIRIPAGIYVTPYAKVTRTVVLEEGQLFYFRIYDVMEDGIQGGSGTFLSCADSLV